MSTLPVSYCPCCQKVILEDSIYQDFDDQPLLLLSLFFIPAGPLRFTFSLLRDCLPPHFLALSPSVLSMPISISPAVLFLFPTVTHGSGHGLSFHYPRDLVISLLPAFFGCQGFLPVLEFHPESIPFSRRSYGVSPVSPSLLFLPVVPPSFLYQALLSSFPRPSGACMDIFGSESPPFSPVHGKIFDCGYFSL